jgi:hypothetical protein
MNYEQQPDSPKPPQAAIVRNRVLLLDADDSSRDGRAKALRLRGALVDSVSSGADARSLWKPGSHDVVLIDLRSAGPDIHDFYEFAHGASGAQKFGFYLARPPYLAASRAEYETAKGKEGAVRPSPRNPLLRPPGTAARYRVGVPEAAQRIAAAKRLSRSHVENENAKPHGLSFSEAVKHAERVLEATTSAPTEADPQPESIDQ